MGDSLYVLIIGHNLEAKCDVANTWMKEKKIFQQFQCRQNLLVKRVVGVRNEPTIAGRSFNIVLTPNLNTPGWTHLKKNIADRFKNRVFLYIKSPGIVDVDDESAIQSIEHEFKKTKVYVVTYIETDTYAEQTSAECTIYRKMPRREKKSILDKILIQTGNGKITQSVSGNERCTEPDEVGSKSVSESRSPTSSPVPINPSMTSLSGIKDDSIDEEHQPNVERQISLELEVKIKDEEWDLLHRTLKYGRAKSNHVRANVIGNQGAGKTTVIERLHGKEVKCPDNSKPHTEALAINEVTSRCTEKDGKKCWEQNKNGGYTEELNLQRMVQAIKRVEKDDNRTVDTDDEITTENFEEDDYQFGSNAEDEVTIDFEEPYAKTIKEQSRIRYMEKIIRKKECSAGEQMYISYWDYAGQSTYYSTHQVFMSPSAVYVLVVDLSQDFQEKLDDSLNFRSGIIRDCSVAESLMFWISSVKAFTTDVKGGKAPMIIVGTHVDALRKISEEKGTSLEREIKEKFDQVRQITKMSEIECVPIDNTDPDETVFIDLKNRILELGLGVIDEEIQAQWIDLDRAIQEHKMKGKVFMSFEELKALDESMDVPMRDQTRLEAFLGHQHNRGHLIHFPHDELRDLIILEPDVLANFLNTLMRSRDQKGQRCLKKHIDMYNQDGIINHSYIVEVAKIMSEDIEGIIDNVDNLVDMLIQLSVIHRYKEDENGCWYLLPCLLPPRPTEEPNKEDVFQKESFQILFTDDHMPPTFFHVFIGGLLRKWKLFEQSPNKPDIFNLHACFRLEKETQLLFVYWESSRVYIDVKNFSRKNRLNDKQIFDILNFLEGRLEEIFIVFRHTNKKYEVRIRCPKHQDGYLKLETLRKEGEALCITSRERHAVDCEDILGGQLLSGNNYNDLQRHPTDKDLGRLALYLGRENANNLAIRLMMHRANVIADRVAQANQDESIRRLEIMVQWRARKSPVTIEQLVELITAIKDYSYDSVMECIETCIPDTRYDKDLTDRILDSVSTDDILKIASNSIDSKFPFLMLELGLRYLDVQQVLANHRHDDMRCIIHNLFLKWRQQYTESATTRLLLNAARFVGIDTTEMQNEMKKCQAFNP